MQTNKANFEKVVKEAKAKAKTKDRRWLTAIDRAAEGILIRSGSAISAALRVIPKAAHNKKGRGMKENSFPGLVAAHYTYAADFATGEKGVVSAESAEDARERFAILWPGAEITKLRRCSYNLTPTYVPDLEGLRKGNRRNVTHCRQYRSA